MSENGPIYGVELIESLPIPGIGMSQAMPGRDELARVSHNGFERTAAAYEVLLAHWRARGEEIERLEAIVDKLPNTADGVAVTPLAPCASGASGGQAADTDVFCVQCSELAPQVMPDETCDDCREPMCFSCYERFNGFCESCHDK